MADKDDDTNRITPSAEGTSEASESSDEEPIVDIRPDEAEDVEEQDMDKLDNEQMKQLSKILEEQQDRINELAEQIALLSTRIAHSEPGIGVCSVCHGPVVLEEPEDSDTPHTIRCQQCGEVYHQY